MRRRSLLIAVPAGLVTLAGCGDEDGADSAEGNASASPSTPEASAAPSPKIVEGPLPAITAGTKFGEKPTVAKGSGDPSKDLAVKTVIAGGGKVVAEKDYIQAHYLGQIWNTGKVFANSYDAKTAALVPLAQGQIYEGWRYGLAGKKVGSRVEMAVPPAWGYGKEGNEQAGVKGTDTLVFVLDIQDTFNTKSSAKGTEVAQDNIDLPKAGANTDGKAPSIEIPKTDPPKKLVANYVIEGDGDEVGADNTVLVQYKGVQWATGKEFDSTYANKQLVSFSLQQVVKGWSQGLTGKKVGSRVLIVIPPDLGYGDNPPQGSGIAKGATLVFTVDILAKM
ncbi:FKBP-type peptidyl-prolyl cis-trans isomerase [Streptomyces sp. DT2A-34]|uniref:FKBP-type peptidyl-prolyl cis-trans isomerase n=1 Tax=Streptomyces sp. DT2A-34 TaxID=3051182 RepID=UPI00265BFAA1|nr:FKBP-type peptidyl-prolyl cis-trans isomerase [Streptomyces sp. DT2A-34]MDO0916213.1 FKBP-type peptidyl-prolyl cis-trans isomerase [Streptomyces sp. DT2A-34]